MVICPHCGLEIEARAKLGKGTQRGKDMKLNANRNLILAIFKKLNRPLTIREIQRVLMDTSIKRESKRNVGWNYHTIQADVSILLGGNYLKMDNCEEKLDDEGFYAINNQGKVPRYKLTGG